MPPTLAQVSKGADTVKWLDSESSGVQGNRGRRFPTRTNPKGGLPGTRWAVARGSSVSWGQEGVSLLCRRLDTWAKLRLRAFYFSKDSPVFLQLRHGLPSFLSLHACTPCLLSAFVSAPPSSSPGYSCFCFYFPITITWAKEKNRPLLSLSGLFEIWVTSVFCVL